MSRTFTLLLCFSCVLAADSMSLADVIAKIFNLCRQKYSNLTVVECVKERSLVALDHIYRSKNDISIIPDFISLTRYDNFKIEERSAKILAAEVGNHSAQAKSSGLDNLLMSRLSDFFGSRAISVKIPITRLDFFSLIPKIDAQKEEGRGKKDKNGLLPMLAMMAGSMLIFKMTAIAIIASKALMASMIAMMLSAIAAFSKKGAHGSSYEVINVPAHGHHSRRLYGETAAYSNQYHRGESIPHESIEAAKISAEGRTNGPVAETILIDTVPTFRRVS